MQAKTFTALEIQNKTMSSNRITVGTIMFLLGFFEGFSEVATICLQINMPHKLDYPHLHSHTHTHTQYAKGVLE